MELTKVHLGLIPGLGLKTHVSHFMVILFDAVYPSFDNFIASGEAHIAQAIIDPGSGIIAVFLDPSLDVVTEGIQSAFSVTWRRRFKWQVRVLDILLNGVTADTQLPGDGPLLQPYTVERDNVQYGLLFFKPISCSILCLNLFPYH